MWQNMKNLYNEYPLLLQQCLFYRSLNRLKSEIQLNV